MRKVLLIPDTHRPYHDEKAWQVMLKAGKKFKPDEVVIMGDFADFYAVSSHSKDPKRALLFKQELDDTIKGLKEVKALKAKKNVFVAGNHEDRLVRYMQAKAPELYDIISIPYLLKLQELGFDYIPYRSHYQVGKLYVTHDVGASGKNAIHQALSTYNRNIVTGHTHRMGMTIQGSIEGQRHTSASFGWLGDLKDIDYMSKAKTIKDWQLGFGIAYIDEKTDFCYIQCIPIIDYTCVLEGSLIKL
jgi:predicted phosphodiesterase